MIHFKMMLAVIALAPAGGTTHSGVQYYFIEYNLCLEIEEVTSSSAIIDADISRLVRYRYHIFEESCSSNSRNQAIESNQLVAPNVFNYIYGQAELEFRAENSAVRRVARSSCPEFFIDIGAIQYIQWPEIGRDKNIWIFAPIDCGDAIIRSIQGVFTVDFETGEIDLYEAWIVT